MKDYVIFIGFLYLSLSNLSLKSLAFKTYNHHFLSSPAQADSSLLLTGSPPSHAHPCHCICAHSVPSFWKTSLSVLYLSKHYAHNTSIALDSLF